MPAPAAAPRCEGRRGALRRIAFGSLALAGSLAGCGRRSADPAGPLDFWAMGREAEVVVELLAGLPCAPSRRSQVRVQQLPWTAAHEKLLTAFAGDALPDLCQLGNTWLPEFSALGALEPLDERMAAAGIPRDDYFAGILDTNLMPGADGASRAARPALVRRHAPAVLSQRSAARRRPSRGRRRPGRSGSAAMADIQRLGGARSYGALLPLNEPDPLFALSLQQGAVLRDGDTRGAFSQPPFRRALDFYAGVFRDGLAPRMTDTQISNVWDEFGRGLFALLRHRPVEHRRVPAPPAGRAAEATGPRRPCPDPTGPASRRAGGSSLVVFKSSPRKEAAWKLISFLSEPETMQRFHALTGDLPPRRSAWRAPALAERRAFAGVRAAARTRARGAQDSRVGAHLPGDAAHGRAGGARPARRRGGLS